MAYELTEDGLRRINEAHTAMALPTCEQGADHELAGFKHRVYAQGNDGCYICALLADNLRLRAELQRAESKRDTLIEALGAIAHKGTTTGTGRTALAYMARQAIKQARAASGVASTSTTSSETGNAPLQGGLSNDELRAVFKRKLPNVEPTERDMTMFALGIETGAAE